MRWIKRLLKLTLFLTLLALPGYYFLVLHTPSPQPNAYRIDMTEVRALANAIPGNKAADIRVEKVAEFVFAEAMVMVGEPWKGTPIPVYSYQINLPGQSIIVDTAVPSMDGMPDAFVGGFDPLAYQRMNVAMTLADKIVITHEHFDHIAGIAAHPNLAKILPSVHLTDEQINHPDRMAPTELPSELFRDYQPLKYDGMVAIAPGVVLIKAAGHTPGSQMVYIQRQDGKEILLLGDVAWQMRNIEHVRERPLFMTAMIKEDRQAVINQFHALNQLMQQEPQLHIVPGHDLGPVNALVEQGLLRRGFVVTSGPAP